MKKLLSVFSITAAMFIVMHCSKKCVGTGTDCTVFSPDTVTTEAHCTALQAVIEGIDSTTVGLGGTIWDCSVAWE
jgi:hypothetical protein